MSKNIGCKFFSNIYLQNRKMKVRWSLDQINIESLWVTMTCSFFLKKNHLWNAIFRNFIFQESLNFFWHVFKLEQEDSRAINVVFRSCKKATPLMCLIFITYFYVFWGQNRAVYVVWSMFSLVDLVFTYSNEKLINTVTFHFSPARLWNPLNNDKDLHDR